MSLLAIGLSHRTAPVALLERVSVSGDTLVKLLRDIAQDECVAEAMIVSTCNRVEVYAAVERFHGAVTAITELLADYSGAPLERLTPHMFVHYEARAVQHLFAVASGLDSMVIGEGQILGQVRQALKTAQDEGTLGQRLNELVQHSLRVGKRAHTETGIDRAGASLVGEGLRHAEQVLGPVEGRRALVVGAGSMSALAAATLTRAGVTDVVVANRTYERAVRLAQTIGGRAVELDDVPGELAEAELVVSCTGAGSRVITREMVAAARAAAPAPARPLFLLDLALPHDVDPEVRALPGVTLVDLESMQQEGLGDPTAVETAGGPVDGSRAAAIEAARRIVAEEVEAYLDAVRAARVTPTVVALRAKAADVVAAELARLTSRVPELDGRARDEVAQTVRRVVDKLLHEPTVRVKQLAASPAGDHYEEALRALFNLDPQVPGAVSKVDPAESPAGPEVGR
jgi:glutamyl-tRNA reductase